MKPLISLLFSTFLLMNIYAQNDTILIVGKIIDHMAMPVANVHVQNLNKETGTTTNPSGFFLIISDAFPIEIKISALGFEDKLLSISKKDYENIENYLSIHLIRKVYNLEEVNINDTKPKEILSNRSHRTILDFKIFGNKLIVLLKQGRNRKLRVIDIDSSTHFERSIHVKANELFEDCMGNIHLFTEDSCHQMMLDLTDSVIFFHKPFSKQKFNSSLGNCAGYINDHFIFKSLHNHNQQITYWHIENKIKKPFYNVHNKDREIFAQDLLNDRKELLSKYGYINEMGDISVAELQIMRRIKHLEWSYKYIGSIPAYNPLFVASDTVLVFDNLKHEIVFFDNSFSYLKTVQMAYQTKNSKKAFHDDATGKIYLESISVASNEFYEIEPSTGKILKTIKIDNCIYPGKVCFYRDKIYYINNSLGKTPVLSVLAIE